MAREIHLASSPNASSTPSLSFFNERENGDLSTATINRWLELSDTTAESQTSVLAKLNNGDPFLMEKQVGDGVIIQMATTCDADWNDLPLQPVFVPLIQQMVSTVASRLSPPRNITTGEPAIALLPDSDSPVSISVLTPQELRISLDSILLDSKPKDQDKVTRRQIAKFTATQHPGVYEMALPNENVHFVAEASRSDSKAGDTGTHNIEIGSRGDRWNGLRICGTVSLSRSIATPRARNLEILALRIPCVSVFGNGFATTFREGKSMTSLRFVGEYPHLAGRVADCDRRGPSLAVLQPRKLQLAGGD